MKHLEEFKVLLYWHEKTLSLSSQLLNVRKPFLWVPQQKYTFWFQVVHRQIIHVVCLSSPFLLCLAECIDSPVPTSYRLTKERYPKRSREDWWSRRRKTVTRSNLEISSQLRGRSMISKNSKMKNIFHLPFLKHMHFSTMQNYLTRETKVLLRETKITGSINKNPNSFYLWHRLCSQTIFIFSRRNWGKRKREQKVKKGVKKKKKEGGY